MRLALLALAGATLLAAPSQAAEPPKFTLAQFAEDTYFDVLHFTVDDASTVIANHMTEAACIHATRYLNAWGAFTACIRE